MHHLMFGHSFAELVALILLAGLAFYFLNKKKASARRNEEDAPTGAPGSLAASAEENSGGSSSSPIETDNIASSSSSTETNNGASSSLNELTGNSYEVFLSFRGPDTRHGFTDHLYHGLLRFGINAFRDDDELCQGEDIRPKLMAAITNSKILIPIFSESYGTSSWCLDELVEIMERKNNNGQIVLPIFYKVKPSDVGHQIGSFGRLFHEREGRLLERSSQDLANLEKWKQALGEVSEVKGYEADGSEVELVNSVVQRVFRELKKNDKLVISENLVGIESHVKNVMELLDDRSHAPLFVGIHGMGGIGKTTLAKAIYDKLSNQFEHRSFIADIRESWKSGVHHLQKKLISDILQREIGVRDENEGTNIISSRLKDKKVLVILDDVDNVKQVKCLAGNHDWFSSRSRIIITTRDKRIYKGAEVDHGYLLIEMDYAQSLILFSKHAFRMDSPPKDFEDLTREVVRITGGLPLCLEVFGSLFCGKESTEWRDMIRKLEKVPRKEVQERLRISYDALDNGQQQIFLDIACFFIGTDKRIPSYMWEACEFFPRVNIEELTFMSLIKIENDHMLKMHDQLRDLGRTIVRKNCEQRPWRRSRLWDSEEALKVLKKNKGTEEIEAINLSKGSLDYDIVEDFRLSSGSSNGDIYTDKQFKNLTSLRFLHMKEGAYLSGDFEDSMDELKWLRWKGCPMNFEVNNFHPTELAILELQWGAINERWQGWSYFKMAEKLKFLDLSDCQFLENTDFLSAFKNLEVLILSHCWRLQQIDSSIGDMKALLRLDLSYCVGLTELPESIESLGKLEILDITQSGIRELPNSIGRLRKLRVLKAFCCENLKGKMPESMRNLSSLQHLDVCGCCELQSLPDLPSSLTYLGITCQSRIVPSLSHLTRLKELMFMHCEFLKFPPTLLKNSECLQLADVEELESPQSLNTPFKLEILKFDECESVEILDVSQLIHLRKLSTTSCDKLLEVRGLDRLEFLEDLSICNCASLERLFLPKSRSLKMLDVHGCNNLAEIQGLDRLEFLENLRIFGCASLERLLLLESRSLKKLVVQYCKNVAKIQGLDRLEFLENLNLSCCDSIENLPILCCFDTLRILTIYSCDKLRDIQIPERFPSCESLWIENCKSLAKLPNLSSFHNLQKLLLSNCHELREIPGLEELISLKHIAISRCSSIGILLDLSSCTRLMSVIVQDCEQLTELRGLEKLEQLVELDISGCKSLKTIPKLPGVRLYQNYEKHPCTSFD